MHAHNPRENDLSHSLLHNHSIGHTLGHTTELVHVFQCFLCVVDYKPILQAPNIYKIVDKLINTGFPMPNSQSVQSNLY